MEVGIDKFRIKISLLHFFAFLPIMSSNLLSSDLSSSYRMQSVT